MDRLVYERLGQIEDKHWWFNARRLILRSVISRFSPARGGLRVLDAGCGTGGNLAMLASFGAVKAFEMDPTARQLAHAKSGLEVVPGSLPTPLPFAAEQFDVITAFDVLEHIEQDVESLSALATRLAPNGRLYVTVPAFAWLWSKHDELHHHCRRYTRKLLVARLQEAGLRPVQVTYFNTLLFFPIVITRLIKRFVSDDGSDERLPPQWINRIFERVFGAESRFIGRLRVPFGVSLLAIAERR